MNSPAAITSGRIKNGVHLNSHASINVDLLESNYFGGVRMYKRGVLRKIAFYDIYQYIHFTTYLNTYVRYNTPKNRKIFIPLAFRGGSRANLKGGQLIMGALKNFQKFMTKVPTRTAVLLYTIIADPNY